MTFEVNLTKKALKDLKVIPLSDRRWILEKIDGLRDGLSGNVKRLTNHTPEYRLRSGDWRALFGIDGTKVVVYRVLHRKDSYR